MRNAKGQFVKGERAHPETEFKKGQHWRKPQAFRDKAWLVTEYVEKKRSTGDIAAQFGVKDASIVYWLRKHGVPRRTVKEARQVKHWGASGDANGMYGRTGSDNPNWNGGLTPLRQSIYAQHEWKKIVRAVRRRDKVCRLCGSNKNTQIHHIVRFSDAPLLAMDKGNLILLCETCHDKMQNKERRWEKRLRKLLQGGDTE